MVPGIRDQGDEALQLLRQIAAGVGSGGPDIHVQESTSFSGQSPVSRVGLIEPRNLVVVETHDLDDANPDGTITVQPGQSKAIVSYEGEPAVLLAVGATDQTDAEYSVVVDNTLTVGGVTNSPLGVLNDPFSFPEKLGGAVPAEKAVDYAVKLDSGSAGSADFAGRLYLEVLP